MIDASFRSHRIQQTFTFFLLKDKIILVRYKDYAHFLRGNVPYQRLESIRQGFD